MNKRFFLKSWLAPVAVTMTLPSHAQASPCGGLPGIPEPIPDFTISDNNGAPINQIDLSRYGACSLTFPICTGYIATGLPAGLSISSAGIISGSYNATGAETFIVNVSAMQCNVLTPQGSFQLTIQGN